MNSLPMVLRLVGDWREMVPHGVGLLGVQLPRGVLGLLGPRELLAEIRADLLARDFELRREHLGADGVGSCHVGHLLWVFRVHYCYRIKSTAPRQLPRESYGLLDGHATEPHWRGSIAVVMIRQMAVPAKKPQDETIQVSIQASSVMEATAKLYGQGYTRGQIANILLEHLYPANGKARNREQKLSQVRSKLRRWETSKDFRDMVWKYAVVKLDMNTPRILSGLTKSAMKGRVDAAKLVLEITDRHTSREGEHGPVSINFTNLPRPEVGPEDGVSGGHRVPRPPVPEERKQLMRRRGSK